MYNTITMCRGACGFSGTCTPTSGSKYECVCKDPSLVHTGTTCEREQIFIIYSVGILFRGKSGWLSFNQIHHQIVIFFSACSYAVYWSLLFSLGWRDFKILFRNVSVIHFQHRNSKIGAPLWWSGEYVLWTTVVLWALCHRSSSVWLMPCTVQIVGHGFYL